MKKNFLFLLLFLLTFSTSLPAQRGGGRPGNRPPSGHPGRPGRPPGFHPGQPGRPPYYGGYPYTNVDYYGNTFKNVSISTYERGSDVAEAFDIMKNQSPEANIYAVVRGRSYDQICNITAMSNASLVTIQYGNRCDQTEVVAVEDIERLGIRGSSTRGAGNSPIHVYFPQSTDHTPHDHRQIHDVQDMSTHGQSMPSNQDLRRQDIRVGG